MRSNVYINERDVELEYNLQCARLNGQLAATVTPAEAHALSSLSQKLKRSDLKFVMDSERDLRWQWPDGSLPYSYFWGKKQDNHQKRCAAISRTRVEWIGVYCSHPFPFICEQLLGKCIEIFTTDFRG